MRIVRLTLSPHVATGILHTDHEQQYVAQTTVGRLEWPVPEDVTGGGTVTVTAKGFTTHEGRMVLPPGSTELAWEREPGVLTTEPMALVPAVLPAIRIQGDQFYRGDQVWKVAGSTELQFAAKVKQGLDLRPILQQRKAAGANLVRILGMHEGAGLIPTAAGYADVVKRTLDLVGDDQLACLWCVFAGTSALMPSVAAQRDFWQQTGEWIRPYKDFTLLDLGNELNHAGQSIDPRNFAPIPGLLCSRGSNGTDEQPPKPWWHFIVYHARRDYPSPKGATNMCPYVAMDAEDWPLPPALAEESCKPEKYGYNHAFTKLMAEHACIGAGGLFHTEQGVYSDLWPPDVVSCAEVFYRELLK